MGCDNEQCSRSKVQRKNEQIKHGSLKKERGSGANEECASSADR